MSTRLIAAGMVALVLLSAPQAQARSSFFFSLGVPLVVAPPPPPVYVVPAPPPPTYYAVPAPPPAYAPPGYTPPGYGPQGYAPPGYGPPPPVYAAPPPAVQYRYYPAWNLYQDPYSGQFYYLQPNGSWAYGGLPPGVPPYGLGEFSLVWGDRGRPWMHHPHHGRW